MSEIKYSVRHSNGKSWAVDEWEHYGQMMCKNRTWYFPTKQDAETFKKRRTER